MPTLYASSLATGGGSGTQGSPYTLSQFFAGTPAPGYVKADGTYTTSSTLSLPTDWQDVGGYAAAINDGGMATIQLAANLASATTYLLTTSSQGIRVGSLVLDLNSLTGGGVSCSNNGAWLTDLAVINVAGTSTGIAANGSHALTRCRVQHGGTGTAILTQRAHNCSTRGGAVGFDLPSYAQIARSCVSIGATTGFKANGNGGCGIPEWSLAINCGTGYNFGFFTSRPGSINFAVNCTTASTGSLNLSTVRTLSPSMFADANNGDLRLTASGKADQQVRQLMVGLYGTPGITTDSLADLLAGRTYPVVGPYSGGVVGG